MLRGFAAVSFEYGCFGVCECRVLIANLLVKMLLNPERLAVGCNGYILAICRESVCAYIVLEIALSLIHISEPTRPY